VVDEVESRPDARAPDESEATLVETPDSALATERPSEAPPGLERRQEGSSSRTIASITTARALRDEQAARGRALLRLGLIVGLIAVVALQIPNSDAPGRWVATSGLLGISLWSGLLLLLGRGQRKVDPRLVFAFGLFTVIAILAVTYYAGIFSPTVIPLFIGVYYFGLGDSKAEAWGVYLLAALGYLLLGGLALGGVIDIRRSVFALKTADPLAMVVVTLVLEVFLALTFALAQSSRRATLRAIAELETAQQQIRQREALLNEARADLDRVLGAGQLGRFSGQTLGPYLVGEVIGRGAMGEVYAAEHGSGEHVALKVLHPFVVRDEPVQVQRFQREAELCSTLDSPHIVQVLDSGETVDGSPYLVMERLDGHDLGWYLRENRRLSTRDTVDLVTQVAEALMVADAAGVVHRDLKPQNLFAIEVGRRRLWKVLDFGVSRISDAGSTLTKEVAVGTPSYMSPEQARGEPVDHRTDVFALGILAYRALTGRPPFTAADALSTMYNVVHIQPVRPGQHVRLYPEVELVLALALAKDRHDRFGSAADLAQALRRASRGRLDDKLRRQAERLLLRHPWGLDRTELSGIGA
jgi:serine/threonine-protein kinase